MRLLPIEASTVLLGLRLVEMAKAEGLVAVLDGELVLQRPEFADYHPTLPANEIPALRDKVNCVVSLPTE